MAPCTCVVAGVSSSAWNEVLGRPSKKPLVKTTSMVGSTAAKMALPYRAASAAKTSPGVTVFST